MKYKVKMNNLIYSTILKSIIHFTHPLVHICTQKHTHTLSHSYTHTLSHTHTHPLSLSRTHTLSLSHTHTYLVRKISDDVTLNSPQQKRFEHSMQGRHN